MKKLLWRVITGQELSQLLAQRTVHESAAVGGATVYQLDQGEGEHLAIALPDGQVLVIEPNTVKWPRRRRQEAAPPTPEIAPIKARRKG